MGTRSMETYTYVAYIVVWGHTCKSAQEWTNRTPNATNLSIPCFLVLPGSESTITEITEYIYFSRI